MLFLLNNWRLLVVLGLLVSLAGFVTGVYYKGKAQGKAEVRAEWDAANEAARIAAAAEDAKRLQDKEKADAKAAKTRRDLDGLYAAYRSLRDSRVRSLLPETPSGSASPPTATFDRSGLDNALSGFDRGVTELLEEGDRAIADLNAAREWARGR